MNMDPTLFQTLADPTRLRLLDAMRGRERSVGELVAWLDGYRQHWESRLDRLGAALALQQAASAPTQSPPETESTP